jgi:hypothetical protein
MELVVDSHADPTCRRTALHRPHHLRSRDTFKGSVFPLRSLTVLEATHKVSIFLSGVLLTKGYCRVACNRERLPIRNSTRPRRLARAVTIEPGRFLGHLTALRAAWGFKDLSALARRRHAGTRLRPMDCFRCASSDGRSLRAGRCRTTPARACRIRASR